MSNTPILKEIYDNPQDAIEASKRLGCNEGYRRYLIDGEEKYVPCSDVDSFTKALRWSTIQGKIAASGEDGVFGDNLVGFQFANKISKRGDPFFTLGNFSFVTFDTEKKEKPFKLGEFLQPVNTNSLGSSSVDELNNKLQRTKQAKVNFDKTNFTNYVLYGSLKERIKTSIQEIYEQFPASLTVIPSDINRPNIIYYNYDNLDQTASFRVRLSRILNPFEIRFFSGDVNKSLPTNMNELRNFSKTFDQYVVRFNDVNYPIIDVELPEDINDENNLELVVEGDPFSDVVSLSKYGNEYFFILPNEEKINETFEDLTNFSSYLLNEDFNGEYTAQFEIPYRNENGDLVKRYESLTFPMSDLWNVDIVSQNFVTYMEELESIGEQFDLYKTKLINRFLTDDTLREFDTEDRRFFKIGETYGRFFDETKQFIDGLGYMTNVSYDKVNNLPDLLLKNFAHTLGWRTFDKANIDSIIKSIFSVPEQEEQKESTQLTPYEVDAELWRRLIINSAYLFKSKGTRRSIEFVLELVGIPQSVMEIDEFVSVAEHKLDYQFFSEVIPNIDFFPVSKEGYPTIPNDAYFQESGGYINADKNHIGPYDYGKTYINRYKNFNGITAFDMDFVIDNKKSWVEDTTPHLRRAEQGLLDTNYRLDDYRLVVNTKNLNVFISQPKAFDFTIYRFFRDEQIDINKDLNSVFINEVKPYEMSFYTFLREVFANFVDVKNRKVIQTYPTLSKIYFDYLNETGKYNKNSIDTSTSLGFLKLFDTAWVDLVKQFTPATSILTAGKRVGNSEFIRNKYQYLHGKNDNVNWLGTDGSEFQSKATKEVQNSITQPFASIGESKSSKNSQLKPIELSSKQFIDKKGFSNTNAYSIAYSYSNIDYAKESKDLSQNKVGIISGSTLNDAYNAIGVDYFSPEPLSHVCEYTGNTTDEIHDLQVLFSGNDIINSTSSGDWVKEQNIQSGNGTGAVTFNSGSPNYIEYKAAHSPSNNDINGDNEIIIYNTGNTLNGNESFIVKFKLLHIDSSGDSDGDVFNFYNSVRPIIYNGNSIVHEGEKFEKEGIHYCFLRNTENSNNYIGFKFYMPSESLIKNFGTIEGYVKTYLNQINHLKLQELNVYNTQYYSGNGTKNYVKQPIGYGYKLENTKPDTFLGKTINNQYFADYNVNNSGYTTFSFFDRYTKRDKKDHDQLMHIEPHLFHYEKVFNNNFIDINLTDKINLENLFFYCSSGTTCFEGNVLKPSDNEINNDFFINNSLEIDLDGFYLNDNISDAGPHYTILDSKKTHPIIKEDHECKVNTETYINFNEFYSGSTASGNDIQLIDTTQPSFFSVINDGFFEINVNLIFNSQSSNDQDVLINVRNQNNILLHQETFTFNNQDTLLNRTTEITFSNFYEQGDEIYISIKPLNVDCKVQSEQDVGFNGDLNITPFEHDQNTNNDEQLYWWSLNNFSYSINDVFFENATNGLVFGNNGLIASTSNSGITWSTYDNLSITSNLNSSDFNSGSVGIVVGDDGVIVRTDNNGSTWQQVTSNVTNHLYDVEFFNNTTGYTVGDYGVILKTTDSGSTWTQIVSGLTSYHLYNVNLFSYDNHLYISGIDGYLAGININSNDDNIVNNWNEYSTNLKEDFISANVATSFLILGTNKGNVEVVERDSNNLFNGSFNNNITDNKINDIIITPTKYNTVLIISDKFLWFDFSIDLVNNKIDDLKEFKSSIDDDLLSITEDNNDDLLIGSKNGNIYLNASYPLISTVLSGNFDKMDRIILHSNNIDELNQDYSLIVNDYNNSFKLLNVDYYGNNLKEFKEVFRGVLDLSSNDQFSVKRDSTVAIKESFILGVNKDMHDNLTFWERQIDNFTLDYDSIFPSFYRSDGNNSGFYYKNNNPNNDDFNLVIEDKYYFKRKIFNGITGKTEDDQLFQLFFDSKKNNNLYGSFNVFFDGQNNVILRYNFDKNIINDPITGEFIGRLTITDPCGNIATCFIDVLLDVSSDKDISENIILDTNSLTSGGNVYA